MISAVDNNIIRYISTRYIYPIKQYYICPIYISPRGQKQEGGEAPQLPISPAGPAASRIKRERRMISGGVCRHLNHLEQRRLSKIGRFWRPWVSLVSARRGRVGQFCKGSPPSVREANFLLLSAYCMPAQTNSPLGPATSKSRKNIFVPSQ